MPIISVNQRLLQARTIEVEDQYGGGRILVVKYPKKECSKNRAWQHLISKPPEDIGKRNIKKDNPWEKNHHGDFWSWIADIG